MSLLKRTTLDPDICHGKPCVRHMRWPVEAVLELISSGMEGDEILADHPGRTGLFPDPGSTALFPTEVVSTAQFEMATLHTTKHFVG